MFQPQYSDCILERVRSVYSPGGFGGILMVHPAEPSPAHVARWAFAARRLRSFAPTEAFFFTGAGGLERTRS